MTPYDDCEEEKTDDDEYEEAEGIGAGESDSVEEEFGAEGSIGSSVEGFVAIESFGGDIDRESESQIEKRDVESDAEVYEKTQTGHADHENEGDGVGENSKKVAAG